MTWLIAGLIIFFAIHVLPMFQQTREMAIERFGVLPYKGLFALLALLGFALIVWGKSQAVYVEVWTPPHYFSIVTKIVMLPAMVLLAAAYIPSNFKRRVRHPMLMAVKLWALGHLFINGDVASMLLFTSFLAYAVLAMVSANRRAPAPELPEKPLYLDVAVLLVGALIYAAVGMYHYQLFGVAIH